MDQVERLDGSIEQLDGRILETTTPFASELARLMTIPGLSRPAAEVILAEIGADMTVFPTAGHLCSWAGMSPGNHQSAGKRYSGRTTKGSPWLRSVLIQAAWSASHTKKTRLSATYHKLARRIGKKRAVVAVGRKILKLVYELLKGRTDYQERLGSDQAARIEHPAGAWERWRTMEVLCPEVVTCQKDVIDVRGPRLRSSKEGRRPRNHPLGIRGFQSSRWEIPYNRGH